jgi:WD repeat-containing protein 35
MEKTRLYVINDTEQEEPINSNAYIAEFDNLEVKTVLLDDIIKSPLSPSKDSFIQIESKSLRDIRSILAQSGLAEAVKYASKLNHPKVWRVVGEEALILFDLSTAQKCYIQCQDYNALQFIKRIAKFNNENTKTAEVYAFLNKFEAAEQLLLEADRKDLVIDLRIRMGDWFRVAQLIKSGGGGDDQLLEKAWNHIGDHYYERQKWSQAITYYSQGRNVAKLAEVYYLLEDYESLGKLSLNLSENSPFLKTIADNFAAAGLCDQAVSLYLKLGDISSAVNICVYLNQWNTAVELAEAHNFQGIQQVITKYAAYLLQQDRKCEAVQLYRKANYCQKSAQLLFKVYVSNIRWQRKQLQRTQAQ